jgi:hypothetical protein
VIAAATRRPAMNAGSASVEANWLSIEEINK